MDCRIKEARFFALHDFASKCSKSEAAASEFSA